MYMGLNKEKDVERRVEVGMEREGEEVVPHYSLQDQQSPLVS